MKKKLYFFFIFFVTQISFSQKKEPVYLKLMEDFSVNFYTVCDSAEAYFKTIEKEKKGSGYKPFLRWKYLNESKYFPSGNRMVDHYLHYNEYQRIKNESNSLNERIVTNSWQSVGPDNISTITSHYAPGLGRVEFVEVNKNNDQEIYIGSRSGGLWRTSNGGATWSQNTDFLPGSGVNAIAANPTNFNSVLINVRVAENGTSFGIYKSNDGGLTFAPTNFVPANIGFGGLGTNFKIYTIQYHPTIANLVFVGTNQGLYRSTDNLTTWTRQIIGGDVLDIDFHPTNNNIIYIYDDFYAANTNRILKSVDTGLNYTPMQILTGNAGEDLKISTASVCPNCVFVSSDNGFWKSTDSGVTFTTIHNPPPAGIELWQAMPNDLDITKIVCGYVDMYRSTDSGANFTQCSWWDLGNAGNGSGSNQQNFTTSNSYVHADNNYLDCVNGVFYSCSDGFLSKSSDNGQTWQKLSLSVGIRENYCVGTSQSNHYVSICGSQDNGTSIKKETGWVEAYGADGMEALVLPLNPNYMIGSTQRGSRKRYTDGVGNNVEAITPPNQTGSWIAPLVYDPNNHMTLYSFGIKVHKSIDYGTTWTDLGTPTTFGGLPAETAAIANNNSNIMVVTRGSAIELSTNGGVSFTNIKNTLPNTSITDVAFEPNNDATIIVTYASYQNDSQKVFISTNSGATWQNITYNLGNMPIYSIAFDNKSDKTIYLGAAIGIYKKTMAQTSWSLYNTNLPNVTVRDLEINFGSNTLKAATWGRGLWENVLSGRESFPRIVKTEITSPPTFSTPKVTIPQFVTSQIEYSGMLTNVYVSWAISTPSFNGTNVIAMSLVSGNTWKSVTPLPDYPVGTKVFFKVTAVGSSSDITETYKFMYELKPYEYCSASGENISGDLFIKRFECSNLDNNNTVNNGYTYYNTTPILLFKGENYTAKGTFNYTFSTSDFYVWTDFDNDADFEENEKVVSNTNNITTGFNSTSQGSFVVPSDAYVGNIRMRVRYGYFNESDNSCGTTLGEVEDYLVRIADKPIITFSGNTLYCLNENVTLTYTGSSVGTINWELSNGLNTYNFTGNSLSTSILPAGSYTIIIRYTLFGIALSEVFENYFTVTPIPSAVNVTNSNEALCAGNTRQLTATGGNTIGNKRSKSSGNINLSIPDNNLTTGVVKTLTVSNVPSGATVTQVEVKLNIVHPWLKDLRINLEAPNGKIVNLYNQHGDSGQNLTNTIITSNTAAAAFTNVATAAPFTGIFRASLANQTTIASTPAVNSILFSELFTIPNGDWKVRVYDDGGGDIGTLLNCSIVVTYNTQQIVWSPVTNLFTDASCTVPYVQGQVANSVYAKPTVTITYLASGVSPSCGINDGVTFTINTVSNRYSGGFWSQGVPPAINGGQILEFDNAAGYSSTGDISGCSCIVTSGNVIINSSHTMNLDGKLTVNGGSLTFKNGASLLQKTDVANTGNIRMERIATIAQADYVYWSSPVSSFLSSSISPLTPSGYIYKWVPTIPTNMNGFGNWTLGNENMVLGKGYIVRGPNNFTTTPAPFTAAFVGVPNNGVIQTPIFRGTYDGVNYNTGASTTLGTKDSDNWNLIGNPYPSAIDAVSFLNTNTNIAGFIKLWTHGTLPSLTVSDPFYGNYVYNYNANDYITYNATGVTSGPGTFNGKIASGQGFFVLMNHTSTSTSESVNFTNSLRRTALGAAHNNTNFFRTGEENSDGKIWLDLVGPDGKNVRSLLGYVADATNDLDRLFDASTDVNLSLDLYTIQNEIPLSIQGRALPFDETEQIPLGIKISQAGNYNIGIGVLEGFMLDKPIFLQDNQIGVIHDLRLNPYSFVTESGNFKNRFVLRYTNETLGFDDFMDINNSVFTFINEGIGIQTNEVPIKSVKIFDVLGKLLISKEFNELKEVKIQNLSKTNSLLIVQIELINGTIVNKKISY